MFCNGIGCPKKFTCKHYGQMISHFAKINNRCGHVYIKEKECIDGGWYWRYEEES